MEVLQSATRCHASAACDQRASSPATGVGVAPWLRPHTVCGPFCRVCGQLVDNSACLLVKLARLLQNGADISDVELEVGGRVFRLHRVMLACSSDVLRVMLLERARWPESVVTRIRLHEDPACAAVFDRFVAYFYTGVVQLDRDNVLALLTLADKYNVHDLQDVCIEYMQSHLVSSISEQRCIVVAWLHYATLSAHRTLADACHQFVLSNFHQVALCAEFCEMECDVLVGFLRRSDLVVPDEMEVYRAARRWLLPRVPRMPMKDDAVSRDAGPHDDDDDVASRFTHLVSTVFSCVRFSLLSRRQLAELASSGLPPADDALRAGLQMALSAERDTQLPLRNYTCDVWSASLSVDNFSALPPYTGCPLFFSSPAGGTDVGDADAADGGAVWEWTAELFPKGVRFERCVVIGLWRNLEVSGASYETVRLTVEARARGGGERGGGGERRVTLAVLVTGVQDGVEYVRRVVERRCTFDATERAHCFDLLPYADLNGGPGGGGGAAGGYLSGEKGDCFRITIIVKAT